MGKKLKRRDNASALGSKLPSIAPSAKCKLRLLKLERVKDWLLMEEEFVQNQERLKPQEERNEEDRTKVRCTSEGARAGGGRWWQAVGGAMGVPAVMAAKGSRAPQRVGSVEKCPVGAPSFACCSISCTSWKLLAVWGPQPQLPPPLHGHACVATAG